MASREANDPKRSFSELLYSITSSAAQRSHGPNQPDGKKSSSVHFSTGTCALRPASPTDVKGQAQALS
jgi:hypothetical protein